MLTGDTELIFPPRVIPDIAIESQGAWRVLAQQASQAAEGSREKTAFVLMMARLNGCASCNADSFRALHGCAQCARQTIRRYKGTPADLGGEYEKALKEVSDYISSPIHR